MRFLSFPAAEKLLGRYGVKTVPSVHSGSPQELLSLAGRLKPPFALKATGRGINHKSERGLVALHLHTPAEAVAAARQMATRLTPVERGSVLFVLQEMRSGAEFLVGAKKDASFGCVALFGVGGTGAELYSESTVRLCPLSKQDAAQMLSETKAAAFFSKVGFRGVRVSPDAVEALLLAVSRLALAEGVEEMDLNPVIANSKGLWVADARVFLR
ncbi:hypothetical protein AUJ14_02275 [Candidatus Micrarchaeota archaeon CG1_02_55_22]|nr:MAG: hypothetical protein AUJ14_02275 [Candidatus Micrarchaeota archaeon CG1_02_55_22]